MAEILKEVILRVDLLALVVMVPQVAAAQAVVVEVGARAQPEALVALADRVETLEPDQADLEDLSPPRSEVSHTFSKATHLVPARPLEDNSLVDSQAREQAVGQPSLGTARQAEMVQKAVLVEVAATVARVDVLVVEVMVEEVLVVAPVQVEHLVMVEEEAREAIRPSLLNLQSLLFLNADELEICSFASHGPESLFTLVRSQTDSCSYALGRLHQLQRAEPHQPRVVPTARSTSSDVNIPTSQ